MKRNRTHLIVGGQVVAIGIGVAAATLGHYLTDPSYYLLHNVYQRMYYIPLLLACAWFGLRAGLATAILCAAVYSPHVLHHWENHQAYQTSQAVELGMFVIIAAVAGVLSDRERALRRSAEATAAERDAALRELEQMLETLRRTDRLATLGTLAASVAHEIRNPLSSLSGALEIIDQDFPADHPRREFVDILRRELGRLNAIAGGYLAFGTPQPPQLSSIDVNQATLGTVELLRRMAARAGVSFDLRLDPALPSAVADPDQIKQVLVNVLINAVQAMPAGGVIEVSTRALDGAVEVSIRDHGDGIPLETADRLFEPFFTTKQGGSGLGLAVSRQIVTAHGGRLEAENPTGGGACFRITLVAEARAGG